MNIILIKEFILIIIMIKNYFIFCCHNKKKWTGMQDVHVFSTIINKDKYVYINNLISLRRKRGCVKRDELIYYNLKEKIKIEYLRVNQFQKAIAFSFNLLKL